MSSCSFTGSLITCLKDSLQDSHEHVTKHNILPQVLTQIVLETVAGLVGVGESGVKGSRPVALNLLLNVLSHRFEFYSLDARKTEYMRD